MASQEVEIFIFSFLILYGAFFRSAIFSRLFVVSAAVLIFIGVVTVGIQLSFIVVFVLIPAVAIFQLARSRFSGKSFSRKGLRKSEAN